MDPKPSASPDRHTFQREGYLRRCAEEGKEPDPDYLALFDQVRELNQNRFSDPEIRDQSLEWHLLTTDWILDKVRGADTYAQNLYAALCNNEFQRLEVMPVLRDDRWSCTWRYAGGIIADMRQEGDYIDWYCSGIRHPDGTEQDNYVGEGCITDEIRGDLLRLGWQVCDRDG